MLNFFKKKESNTIVYLKKDLNLKHLNQIEEQIKSNEKIIEYNYKDDKLYIVNEEASLYHIVNTTSKLEKLANSIVSNEVDIMFDIGANVGIFGYFFKKKYPNANIFLFEPDKKLLPIIEKNLSKFIKNTIINSAVSDFNGEIDFFYNPNSSQTNSTEIEALLPFIEKKHIIKNSVPCTTLNTFCKENQIYQIDVLKIDIQGGEYRALKSSEETLKFTKEILLEVCFLMPETIPLINLMYQHYKNYKPINEIIMGADLKFSK